MRLIKKIGVRCALKDSVLYRLSVNGPEIQLRMSTVLGEGVIICQRITGLVIQGPKETTSIHLPGAYSRKVIPARRSQIPRPETVHSWPHLVPIANELMPYREDIEVGLPIGTNCVRAIKPIEVIPGKEDDLYAKKTALGWGVIGVVNLNNHQEEDSSDCLCHRTLSLEVNPSTNKMMCHFALKTDVKEILNPFQLTKMFEQDFNETKKEGQALSHDDRKFIQKVRGYPPNRRWPL